MASALLNRSIFKVATRQAPKSSTVLQSRRISTASRASGNGSMGGPLSEAPGFARTAVLRLGLAASVFLAFAQSAAAAQHKNVLGGPLEQCCTDPMTGFHRDGYCRVDGMDFGVHAVCAQITQEFLDYTASRGNDLSSVVKDGQRWCLCSARWKEAKEAGKAPKIYLKSTAEEALKTISLDELKEYAIDGEGAQV